MRRATQQGRDDLTTRVRHPSVAPRARACACVAQAKRVRPRRALSQVCPFAAGRAPRTLRRVGAPKAHEGGSNEVLRVTHGCDAVWRDRSARWEAPRSTA